MNDMGRWTLRVIITDLIALHGGPVQEVFPSVQPHVTRAELAGHKLPQLVLQPGVRMVAVVVDQLVQAMDHLMGKINVGLSAGGRLVWGYPRRLRRI